MLSNLNKDNDIDDDTCREARETLILYDQTTTQRLTMDDGGTRRTYENPETNGAAGTHSLAIDQGGRGTGSRAEERRRGRPSFAADDDARCISIKFGSTATNNNNNGSFLRSGCSASKVTLLFV